MLRAACIVSSLLLLGSHAVGQSRTECLLPPAAYQFKQLDKLPAPVITTLKKRIPDIQPSAASCQSGSAKSSAGSVSCFFAAVNWGNRWAVVVTYGAKPGSRLPLVYAYEQGGEVSELSGAATGIPICAINRLSGVAPKR